MRVLSRWLIVTFAPSRGSTISPEIAQMRRRGTSGLARVRALRAQMNRELPSQPALRHPGEARIARALVPERLGLRVVSAHGVAYWAKCALPTPPRSERLIFRCIRLFDARRAGWPIRRDYERQGRNTNEPTEALSVLWRATRAGDGQCELQTLPCHRARNGAERDGCAPATPPWFVRYSAVAASTVSRSRTGTQPSQKLVSR